MTQEPKRLMPNVILVDGLPFCATLLAGAALQRFTGIDHQTGRIVSAGDARGAATSW